MNVITRFLAALGVALLVMIGGATTAGAAEVSAVEAGEYGEYAPDSAWSMEPATGISANVWCDYTYNPANVDPHNHVWWSSDGYPDYYASLNIANPADYAAAVVVKVPAQMASAPHRVTFGSADCGFVRFWHSRSVYHNPSGWDDGGRLSSDGRALAVDLREHVANDGAGFGGDIFGETVDGALYPVALMVQVVPTAFIPDTGEPTPEPEPEPEPVPEVTPEPEPEPTPEPPVVPTVPEEPEVPEVPEEPAPPVVDEPEPVVPFAPSTGIEVDEPSSSLFGWVLIGSGLSLGAAGWLAVRRWL